MSQENRKMIFVGGISPQTSKSELYSYFESFGRVTKLKIAYNKKTKEPKGYAYVTMQYFESVEAILSETHWIGGRKADCQLAAKKSEKRNWKDNQRRRRIFLKNIPNTYTTEELSFIFSRFGPVRSSYIMEDQEAALGCGYVEFVEVESVEKALKGYPEISPSEESRMLCLPYLTKAEQVQASLQVFLCGRAVEAEDEEHIGKEESVYHREPKFSAMDGDRPKRSPRTRGEDDIVEDEQTEQDPRENGSTIKCIALASKVERLLFRGTPLHHSRDNLRFNIWSRAPARLLSSGPGLRTTRDSCEWGPKLYRLFM